MFFTDRLNELKASRNIMQKDIAIGANIPLRTFQRYEKGDREPPLSVLIALADYFDVSIDYLVGRTDNPNINR